MKQIEGWKVRREVLRLHRQFVALPKTLVGYVDLLLAPARRRQHQASFASRVQMHDGACPAGKQIAIYFNVVGSSFMIRWFSIVDGTCPK